MKLTIIPIDKSVYKNQLCYSNLDLSKCEIPNDVHALQWNENQGWIEFVNNIKPNEIITELPQWANDAENIWQQIYDAEQTIILQDQIVSTSII